MKRDPIDRIISISLSSEELALAKTISRIERTSVSWLFRRAFSRTFAAHIARLKNGSFNGIAQDAQKRPLVASKKKTVEL